MNVRPIALSLTLAAALTTPLVASTTTAVAAAPSCHSGQLQLKMTRSQGTAGATIYSLQFTNTGATCTLFGVLSLQPVAGTPLHNVGPLSMNDSRGEMAVLHTLQKGQSVVSPISFTDTDNYPTSRCAPVAITGVRVTLGDDAVAFVAHRFVPQVERVCTKLPSVSAKLLQ